jgi:hypothetical protein
MSIPDPVVTVLDSTLGRQGGTPGAAGSSAAGTDRFSLHPEMRELPGGAR